MPFFPNAAFHLMQNDKEITERLRHTLLAAIWCQTKVFNGTVTLPDVLKMDSEDQCKAMEHLQTCQDEDHLTSPCPLFLFIFQYQRDFEMFCEDFIDNKVDGSFEKSN